MTNPNNEDEADEIVRRLSKPPLRFYSAKWDAPTHDIYDILSKELAAAISDEIDKEILAAIMKEI